MAILFLKFILFSTFTLCNILYIYAIQYTHDIKLLMIYYVQTFHRKISGGIISYFSLFFCIYRIIPTEDGFWFINYVFCETKSLLYTTQHLCCFFKMEMSFIFVFCYANIINTFKIIRTIGWTVYQTSNQCQIK